jgi:hypothetical protein
MNENKKPFYPKDMFGFIHHPNIETATIKD